MSTRLFKNNITCKLLVFNQPTKRSFDKTCKFVCQIVTVAVQLVNHNLLTN